MDLTRSWLLGTCDPYLYKNILHGRQGFPEKLTPIPFH